MPVVTPEAKKELLGTVGKLPAPLKMAVGSKIKEAESFVKKLDRYAVLPVKIGEEIVVVTMFAGTKAPPIKVTPNYDLDDLRYLSYTLVRAYQKLKPNATAQELLRDLFSNGEEQEDQEQNGQGEEEEGNDIESGDEEEDYVTEAESTTTPRSA
jgi:hypothetical protein